MQLIPVKLPSLLHCVPFRSLKMQFIKQKMAIYKAALLIFTKKHWPHYKPILPLLLPRRRKKKKNIINSGIFFKNRIVCKLTALSIN